MENMEEIYRFLEDFSKRKPKVIPQELNEYLAYVARTGDPVYQWSLVKSLFKEKLLNVITDFYESTPSIEIPPYPNVDPFNYEVMKNSLLERLDSFASAPFTVQRICELLTYPRKQYNRVDKFMRAVEKNILVVSTRDPGPQRPVEQENGEPAEPIVNGSDNNSDYNIDVEMEDMSWKENQAQVQAQATSSEPQPSSSETHISVDDIEARLSAKQDTSMQLQEKTTTEYESVTPPELNVTAYEQEMKPNEEIPLNTAPTNTDTSSEKMEETTPSATVVEEPKIDEEMKPVEMEKDPLIIPEIKVDDAEMTEQRLTEESNKKIEEDLEPKIETPIEVVSQEEVMPEPAITTNQTVEQQETVEDKVEGAAQLATATEECSTFNVVKDEKEETDNKTLNEVLTSSEESSSSSDNTDGNSNSPKHELQSDSMESSSDTNQADTAESVSDAEVKAEAEPAQEPQPIGDNVVEAPEMQSENYSISDVKSELVQPAEEASKPTEPVVQEKKEETPPEPTKDEEQTIVAPEVTTETTSEN